jgi:hypothetical protein
MIWQPGDRTERNRYNSSWEYCSFACGDRSGHKSIEKANVLLLNGCSLPFRQPH